MTETTVETQAAEKRPARKIRIRQATVQDAVRILQLHLESHEEARKMMTVRYPSVDESKLIRVIVDVITTGCAYVADLDGRVVGSIGLQLAQLPWSSDNHIGNPWFDVLPNFRRDGIADSLLQAAEMLAESKGLALIIEFNSILRAEAKDRWVKERGFTYIGGALLKS